jgi:hypothetical protein
VTASSVWDAFEFDPRLPQHAQLRASDADRDVAQAVLGRAYGDGRLTREEFDQRSEAVLNARTLGELPAELADLVPPVAPSQAVAVPDNAVTSVQEQAVARYRSRAREALWGFLSASLVCWVIWGVTSAGGFPWPVFVMLGTGLNLGRTLVMRQDIVDTERQRLERKAREAGGDRAPRSLESRDDESP